ncbi:MAG: VCBS repeat-containing protein [Sandaracinus sp.]
MKRAVTVLALLLLAAPGCSTPTPSSPSDAGRDAAGSDGGAPDAPLFGDAGTDASAVDAPAFDADPPRSLAPLSTSTASTRRPTFHWELAAGTDGAHVEICSDRACATSITSFDAVGTSGAPSADLPSGVVFWRLASRAGSATAVRFGPVWEVFVPVASSPTDTSSGTTLDVDGDGIADVAVGANANGGSVHVLVGGGTLGTATPITILGSDGAALGTDVASAGDVDGDGFGEILVGSGAHVYLFAGGPGDLATAPTTTLAPPESSAAFGTSVAGVGDVNGDGYGDVLVGAHDVGGNAGAAYVYLGSASGLATTPATTIHGPAGAWLGVSVAGAGDVNGDGFADVAIGAHRASDLAGRAYVHLGSATGIAATASTDIPGPAIFRGMFGVGVAGAGDVDGDGFDDVVVVDGTSHGYVFEGGASGIGTTATTTLAVGSAAARGGALAGAGDVDGDGFDDVAFGNGEPGGGTVLVFRGSSSGVGTSATWTLADPDGASSYFGSSVAGLGDVNGDGAADLGVGAFGVTSSTGRVYVYHGSTTALATTPSDTVLGTRAGGQFGWALR